MSCGTAIPPNCTHRPGLLAALLLLLSAVAAALLPAGSHGARPARRTVRPVKAPGSPALPGEGSPSRKAITSLEEAPETEHQRGARAASHLEPTADSAVGCSPPARHRPDAAIPGIRGTPLYLTLLILLV
jgi:hypothetical protein